MLVRFDNGDGAICCFIEGSVSLLNTVLRSFWFSVTKVCLALAVVVDRVIGEDARSMLIPISLPFPFPGVFVLVPLPLPTPLLASLNSSNLCNNNSNPTSPLGALHPPPAELNGVGADRDCRHGLFLGRDESEGREEQMERGF